MQPLPDEELVDLPALIKRGGVDDAEEEDNDTTPTQDNVTNNAKYTDSVRQPSLSRHRSGLGGRG